MSTIIVCTDFSKKSRNALTYTCNLFEGKEKDLKVLLLHVFTIPANYAGEGLSLVTINDEWQDVEREMEEELQWARKQYPNLTFTGQFATGSFLRGLKEQVEEVKPSLVVIGASGNFGDLWSWDRDILDLIRDATVPVLTVPQQATFTPVHNIGFACNVKNVNPSTPFETIKNLVRFTDATLHVLSVTTPEIKKSIVEQNETIVHDQLKEVSPQYYTVQEEKVVGAIGNFVQQQHINMLLVTPRRHGVWEALFHKSHTKELMRLNCIPIMALH